MGQVQPAAGQLGQGQVAGNHRLFRRRRDAGQPEPGSGPALGHHPTGAKAVFLTVIADGHSQVQGVGQGQPHNVGVIYRVAVITKGHHSGGGQFLHFGQFFPPPALGYAANGKDPHHAVGARPSLHQFHHRLVIYGRVGVGHATNGGKTAASRGTGAGGDSLFVLEPRLPQMTVQINEPGGGNQAVGRNRPAPVRDVGGGQPGAGGNYLTAGNQDVTNRVHTPAGVNDSGTLNQYRT